MYFDIIQENNFLEVQYFCSWGVINNTWSIVAFCRGRNLVPASLKFKSRRVALFIVCNKYIK